jgi:hypothetical protein
LRVVLGQLLRLPQVSPEGPILVTLRLLFLDPFERATLILILLAIGAVFEVVWRSLD